MSRHETGCPKAFVLGHPIKHSKSPLLHRAAYRALGVEMEYERLDTQVDQLAEVFARHTPEGGTRGFSVTMPLKSAVKDQVDKLTPFAQALGVVNTVYWQRGDDGQFTSWGDNTDVSGIVNALRQAGLVGKPQRAAIIGGGGTATAALAALRAMGADGVRVFVRDASRAQGVADAATRLGLNLDFSPIDSFAQSYAEFDVTICTLPAGAADRLLAAANRGKSSGYLLDVSYDPWPSVLAGEWESLGGTVTSGLEMLVYQAVDQVKLFTGQDRAHPLPQQKEVLAAMRQAVGLPPTGFDPESVNGPDWLKS
ncbi:MAG: shikimate dehydrogenase [Rothia sp. (in: high G+C Gram-positive bacteria)]|uniref:shikimate dehydrogenase family protein n=1 Tax=Rothia sp. (in: high G+C Gram-positive bacteria) TaxID=1885016 RepID=UPI0027004386|nr:shikimate dehydrogenase [Rothia sp. (in: high G+C Gram-positive bacteria)]